LVLVGCDAEGLELRGLGHYMAKYDGGAYADAVVNGKKENGTDVHTVNRNAAGLNLRDSAKTFVYALIYGAGDFKLGTIVYDDLTEEQRQRFLAKYPTTKKRMAAIKRLGTKRRARLMEALPALGELTEAVKAAAKGRGYLRGLDGRLLHVRAEHSALNTLLQSAGAVVMKKALVMLDDALNLAYRCNNTVVEPVANIHDEFQIETQQEVADEIGKLAADCIRKAGEHFNLRCPLAGSYSVGSDWAGTH
jgi:DNA polymerase I-like protein with 3'-5' exonuclease and polymerase domains